MLRALSWHLRDQFGTRSSDVEHGYRTAPSEIHEVDHYSIGIIQQGNDPRHPEMDPLSALVQRRCSLIVYPVSARPGSIEKLDAFAARMDYTVVYFDPLRIGHVSSWNPDERTFREGLYQASSEALCGLVMELIGLDNDMIKLEQMRSRRIMPKVQELRWVDKKYLWPEYLPARAAIVYDVLEDIEGLSYAWDIAKHFWQELGPDEQVELEQMLQLLKAVGRARKWRGKWAGVSDADRPHGNLGARA